MLSLSLSHTHTHILIHVPICTRICIIFASTQAPIYMAEMCPAHIRGSLVTSKEAFIVFGIIVGYSTGNAMSSHPMAWYGTHNVRS